VVAGDERAHEVGEGATGGVGRVRPAEGERAAG
jgi:hypothetical protein